MLVNFLWPRASSNPALSSLPNIPNLGAIGNIPIFEATLGVIVIVGAVYYFFARRGMPETQAVKPAEAPAV